MRTMGLVIFDAYNTLVTSRQGSKRTFLAGLVQTGIRASTAMLADLQAASEGLDRSRWSNSRVAYCGWAAETLAALAQAGAGLGADLGRVPGTDLVVRAENHVHRSDQQGCHPSRLIVMITGHVPAVRLPSDHADCLMAAACVVPELAQCL